MINSPYSLFYLYNSCVIFSTCIILSIEKTALIVRINNEPAYSPMSQIQYLNNQGWFPFVACICVRISIVGGF